MGPRQSSQAATGGETLTASETSVVNRRTLLVAGVVCLLVVSGGAVASGMVNPSVSGILSGDEAGDDSNGDGSDRATGAAVAQNSSTNFEYRPDFESYGEIEGNSAVDYYVDGSSEIVIIRLQTSDTLSANNIEIETECAEQNVEQSEWYQDGSTVSTEELQSGDFTILSTYGSNFCSFGGSKITVTWSNSGETVVIGEHQL